MTDPMDPLMKLVDRAYPGDDGTMRLAFAVLYQPRTEKASNPTVTMSGNTTYRRDLETT